MNDLLYPSESARRVKGYGMKYEPSNQPIHVGEDVYTELVRIIRTECENTDQEYPKVKAEVERGELLFTVETDMALHFKEYKELWGNSTYLHSMAPCWTIFAAYNECGDEIATDFDLPKFHNLLRLKF